VWTEGVLTAPVLCRSPPFARCETFRSFGLSWCVEAAVIPGAANEPIECRSNLPHSIANGTLA
jgi:hypothetical protein